ncbi:MAG TPA: hypothetical protein VGZ48_13250 [Candidatus Acidoferrales bacterium]|nr:hypothetical protein [Candidatus Acidoferrales bacterium]
MRTDEKHFEQVPIEVVETLLREAAAQEKQKGKSPALVSLLDRQAPDEFATEDGGPPSKDNQ